MRRIFQKWLLLFIAIAFGVTFATSYLVLTHQAHQGMEAIILLKIDDVSRQITDLQEELDDLRTLTAASALAKTRALAVIVAKDPSILDDETAQQQLRRELDIDVFHVSDGAGILVASTDGNLGYDMLSQEQSQAFAGALDDPEFELVQDPMPRGADGQLYQHAGVARLDGPGIIQIGYRSERLEQAMQLADIRTLAPSFRIGNSGRLIISRNSTIVSIDEAAHLGQTLQDYGIERDPGSQAAFFCTIDGVRCLGVTRPFREYEITGLVPCNEMYLNRNVMIIFLALSYFILFALIFLLVSALVQRVVISGIHRINRSLARITQGDLEERVRGSGNAELAALSHDINTMVDAMKKAIAEARSRIDAELGVAKAIQVSTLPMVFPAYPERPEFDIYAAMYTAREVGGDFYDFILLDEKRLAVMIADVSGKGIPAALFMMNARTLLQQLVLNGLGPAAAFNQANDELCAKNDVGMFVTVFLGILELDSGLMRFVNAGHNPPLLQRDGRFTPLPQRPDLVLAGLPHQKYHQHEITLAPGERLFLYTDGVTEAMSPSHEFFTQKRLDALLNRPETAEYSLHELVLYVKAEIDRYAAGTEQADDITMLALEYRGGIIKE